MSASAEYTIGSGSEICQILVRVPVTDGSSELSGSHHSRYLELESGRPFRVRRRATVAGGTRPAATEEPP